VAAVPNKLSLTPPKDIKKITSFLSAFRGVLFFACFLSDRQNWNTNPNYPSVSARKASNTDEG
jgi:hypothetical protein